MFQHKCEGTHFVGKFNSDIEVLTIEFQIYGAPSIEPTKLIPLKVFHEPILNPPNDVLRSKRK